MIFLINCCEGLSFRVFADDTNIFFISKKPKELELVMNSAIKSVFSYCNTNRLSLNLRETNYMVVTSPKKNELTQIFNILNAKRWVQRWRNDGAMMAQW